MCNQGDEPVLIPVSVDHDIYLAVKQAAVSNLAIAAAPLGGCQCSAKVPGKNQAARSG